MSNAAAAATQTGGWMVIYGVRSRVALVRCQGGAEIDGRSCTVLLRKNHKLSYIDMTESKP